MNRIGSLGQEFTTPLGAPAVLRQQAGESQSQQKFEFQVATSRVGLEALETDWNELFSRAGRSTQLFQTFNWCWHWCNNFLPREGGAAGDVSLAVLTAWRQGRLVMVWPLVESRMGPLRQLGWLGEPVSQYGDILVEPCADKAELIRAGFAEIKATLRPDLLRLRKVRADAEIAPLLAELKSIASAQAEAPFLDLKSTPDFASYEQRFPTKARRNRRRLLRRLEEQGTVEFECVAAGNEARYTAGLGLAMKREWLAGRGLVSPALTDNRTLAFFQDVAEARVRPAGCRVHLLSTNEEPGAVQLAIVCAGRLALHVIAYNLKHEKSGLGVLHIENTIKTAFDEGIDTIDFLAPKADYKMDWADGTVAVAGHAVALSLLGRGYARFYLGFARDRMKALVERATAWLKRGGRAAPAARRDL